MSFSPVLVAKRAPSPPTIDTTTGSRRAAATRVCVDARRRRVSCAADISAGAAGTRWAGPTRRHVADEEQELEAATDQQCLLGGPDLTGDGAVLPRSDPKGDLVGRGNSEPAVREDRRDQDERPQPLVRAESGSDDAQGDEAEDERDFVPRLEVSPPRDEWRDGEELEDEHMGDETPGSKATGRRGDPPSGVGRRRRRCQRHDGNTRLRSSPVGGVSVTRQLWVGRSAPP